MKPDAWMKLVIGDWLKDTGHLDATATGAYFLLILHHYGKPGVPSDDLALRMMCRVMPQDWARVKATIQLYFDCQNGMWINKRCLEEYAEAIEVYEAKVQGGLTRQQQIQQSTPARTPARTPSTKRQESYSQSQSQSPVQEQEQGPCCPPTPQRGDAPVESSFQGPSLEACEKWLADVQGHGADYTAAEMHSAFNALQAGGWMWGRRPVVDWRAAIERQIQTDRNHRPPSKSTSAQPNAATPYNLNLQRQALKSEMDELKAKSYRRFADGSSWVNEDDRKRYREFKAKLAQVTQQLTAIT